MPRAHRTPPPLFVYLGRHSIVPSPIWKIREKGLDWTVGRSGNKATMAHFPVTACCDLNMLCHRHVVSCLSGNNYSMECLFYQQSNNLFLNACSRYEQSKEKNCCSSSCVSSWSKIFDRQFRMSCSIVKRQCSASLSLKFRCLALTVCSVSTWHLSICSKHNITKHTF